MPQIFQIDVSVLDQEIDRLRKELTIKEQQRSTIEILAKQYGVNRSLNEPQPISVSDFILDYLKEGPKRLDKVIDNYVRRCDNKEVAAVDIKLGIENLKNAEKIYAVYDKELRRTVLGLYKAKD